LIFERPKTDAIVDRQLEILAPDVTLRSTLGTATGHDEYRAATDMLSDTDANAHVVTQTAFTDLGNDQVGMMATVRYVRLGADGRHSSAALSDDTDVSVAGPEPVFTRIEIDALGSADEPTFRDAYPEHRVRSFGHRWITLEERLDGCEAPVREFLAEPFSLDCSTTANPLTDFDAVANWLRAMPERIARSSHEIENLSFTGATDIRVSADCPWRGASPDGTELHGQTHHEWQIEDTGERYRQLHTDGPNGVVAATAAVRVLSLMRWRDLGRAP
jgi:hypothetical protein